MKTERDPYEHGPGGRLQSAIMDAVKRGRVLSAHPGTYLIEAWEWYDGPAPSSILFWVYDELADPIAAVTVDGPRTRWDAIVQPNGTVLKGDRVFESLEAYKIDAANRDSRKRAVEEREAQL